MSRWNIHHLRETASTNLDARAGVPGDVFTADFQTAGRGRLDHTWLSPRGENLMMSVVLDVTGLAPEKVATLPLVVGLVVAQALSDWSPESAPRIKWPNDVLIAGRKVCGILCERAGDVVIAGIGVNVTQREFPTEIASRAVSLAVLSGRVPPDCSVVRDAILKSLATWYDRWLAEGFGAVYPAIAEIDFLKGRFLGVRQTDDDAAPVVGVSSGIMSDGSLDVGGVHVYAGEAHVEDVK